MHRVLGSVDLHGYLNQIVLTYDFPFEGVLPRPGPDGLPVLLGQLGLLGELDATMVFGVVKFSFI